ncbi:hypothetical protein MMC07_004242 [Pseudocyphellaria aurata]|nr:hypothetical protein [Pseudocyphellaria aurata]
MSFSIDELIARKTVQDYGEFSAQSAPNYGVSSNITSERAMIICLHDVLVSPKSEQQTAPPLDVAALQNALENLARQSPAPTTTDRSFSTPSPDYEGDRLAYLELEKQARKDLLEDGCPPCYPADLEYPLHDVPAQYEEIVSYWKLLPEGGDWVLNAQLSGWKKFRDYQKRIRRYHLKRNTFQKYQEQVPDRRRRHGLIDDGRLHPDWEKQSGLENWIEFQYAHLVQHQNMEKKLTDKENKFKDARMRAQGTGVSGNLSQEDVEGYEYNIAYAERCVRRHENLLQWIEQQRRAMIAEQATFVHENEGHNDDRGQVKIGKACGVRRLAASDRRKSERKSRSVLGPVKSGVSKNTSQKRRSLRLQQRSVPQEAELATEKLCENTSLSSDLPPKVSETGKKASRSKRSANLNAKSRPKGRVQGGTKRNPADRAQSKVRKPIQQRSTHEIATRSGRISKRPKRLQPG